MLTIFNDKKSRQKNLQNLDKPFVRCTQMNCPFTKTSCKNVHLGDNETMDMFIDLYNNYINKVEAAKPKRPESRSEPVMSELEHSIDMLQSLIDLNNKTNLLIQDLIDKISVSSVKPESIKPESIYSDLTNIPKDYSDLFDKFGLSKKKEWFDESDWFDDCGGCGHKECYYTNMNSGYNECIYKCPNCS